MIFEIVTTRWLGRIKVYEVDRDAERTWVATFLMRDDAVRFVQSKGARVVFAGEK